MTATLGRVRVVPADQAPPCLVDDELLTLNDVCAADVSTEELLAAGLTWEQIAGATPDVVGRYCNRPPHDPAEVHASRSHAAVIIWGGE